MDIGLSFSNTANGTTSPSPTTTLKWDAVPRGGHIRTPRSSADADTRKSKPRPLGRCSDNVTVFITSAIILTLLYIINPTITVQFSLFTIIPVSPVHIPAIYHPRFRTVAHMGKKPTRKNEIPKADGLTTMTVVWILAFHLLSGAAEPHTTLWLALQIRKNFLHQHFELALSTPTKKQAQ